MSARSYSTEKLIRNEFALPALQLPLSIGYIDGTRAASAVGRAGDLCFNTHQFDTKHFSIQPFAAELLRGRQELREGHFLVSFKYGQVSGDPFYFDEKLHSD